MAELTIKIRKYIGESSFNWDTFEFEEATSADDVRMQVEWAQYDGVQVDSICLEIGTCFGGSTIVGTEIYNYLQSLGLPIRTRIMAFAASMATILMLAGDTCEIDANAEILVHGPSGETWGTVKDMQSGLKLVSDTHQSLHDIYVARTGQLTEVVQEWMSKDTFFTAAEALAAGLVTKVIPIAPKAAPALTDVQASARRARYAGITARADKRITAARVATPRPKAKAPAKAAAKPNATPAPAALNSPRPMATSKTKAAAKPAAKTAPLTAAQKANATIVANLAKSLGVTATIDGIDAEPTAVTESTVLADEAGTLYTDGMLAMDSAVFNDEALTVATDDGEYLAEDGRTITIASGIVTDIVEATDETEAVAPAADIAALITAALAPLTAELATMKATFNKAVPPTPRPVASGSQLADAKTPRAVGKPHPMDKSRS